MQRRQNGAAIRHVVAINRYIIDARHIARRSRFVGDDGTGTFGLNLDIVMFIIVAEHEGVRIGLGLFGEAKDVKDTEGYYKAIMWAVEKGLTKGTSKTTFSPKDPCKRSQIVTFLYRYFFME